MRRKWLKILFSNTNLLWKSIKSDIWPHILYEIALKRKEFLIFIEGSLLLGLPVVQCQVSLTMDISGYFHSQFEMIRSRQKHTMRKLLCSPHQPLGIIQFSGEKQVFSKFFSYNKTFLKKKDPLLKKVIPFYWCRSH